MVAENSMSLCYYFQHHSTFRHAERFMAMFAFTEYKAFHMQCFHFNKEMFCASLSLNQMIRSFYIYLMGTVLHTWEYVGLIVLQV